MTLDVAQLFEEYGDSVYQYVFFRVRHQQLAEEIVQDAFLRVLERGHTYKKKRGATERSWLFTVVRSTLADHYRKKSHTVVDIDTVQPIAHDTDLMTTLQTELQLADVWECVDTLPERQREVLILRYRSDLPNTEIASILGINQRTVSATLSRAIKAVRNHLNTQGAKSNIT